MATTGIPDLDAAMKVIFEDAVFYNTVTDSELMSMFEMDDRVQTDQTTGGRYIETAQYFRLPAGVRAVGTNDYIPIPQGPIIRNSRIYLKKMQGTVEMSGDTMRRVKTTEAAFLDWAERALPDLVERLNDTQDRMLLGFGSGIVARVNDASPDVTLKLDSSFGVAGLTRAALLLQEGEQIVFAAAAAGTTMRDAAGVISSTVLDSDGDDDVILDVVPTELADNDYVFLGDATQQAITDPATSRGKDFGGLLGMVDDGGILASFQGIDRTATGNRKWQSKIVASGGGSPANVLNEDLLALADDEVFVHGGGKTDLIVTSRDANRQYWRSLRLDRALNDPRSFTGGTEGQGIRLGDRTVPIRVARKMPPQLAFGLQRDTFRRHELGKWEWDDTPGSIWNRVTDGVGRKDAFFAVGHLYKEMSCFAPAKNWRIDGINPAAAVSS